VSYKKTLNLPDTSFAMKANLPQREPGIISLWEDIDLYKEIRQKFKGRKQFILHDGPPYANGDIHLGHALNKTLKDIIIKSKTLSGLDAPFIPGWDCHGLPIEINVEKKVGKPGAKVTTKQFREACREYAPKQIEGQKKDFKRLGIMGEWDNPYLTMNYGFEANIIRTLGQVLQNDHVFRGLKPVNWCCDCGSALAEAEVEYATKRSPAIDVVFKCDNTEAVSAIMGCDHQDDLSIGVVIWTTTPWTLPANLAVCLNPEIDYVLVSCEPHLKLKDNSTVLPRQHLLIADALVTTTMERYGCTDYEIIGKARGSKLAQQTVKHPWLDKHVPIILGDHVTTESGTGAVHTAPGHGVDDFNIGQQYNLDVLNPVNNRGVFVEGTEHLEGQFVFKANQTVIDLLQSNQALLACDMIEHSYPHCWRHKSPIIFRATPQWFVSMNQNNLLADALDAVENVEWIPQRGQARISSMMNQRPDWCISRQRTWGVPIAVFYHTTTGDIHPRTSELLEEIAQRVDKDGIDAWFDLSEEDILGDEAKYYTKSTDVLDVWFDSGSSHYCVLEHRDGVRYPADLYLEGSDQHRGWFQSSLLLGIGSRQQAPYKTVLTHGFTVDAEGKKMSKSARNGVSPQKLMQNLGADIIRLWVSSTDYRDDVAVSDEVFKRTSDSYRRIRNTARFLLSNLNAFNPDQHVLPYNNLLSIDQWAISSCSQFQKEIIEAYDQYDFHIVYQKIHHFCANVLGGFYLSIIKDRVYTMQPESLGRRSAQTAMFSILESLVRWIAPILSFTSEEIWQVMIEEGLGQREASVHLSEWYTDLVELNDDATMNDQFWNHLQEIKQSVNKLIEQARSEGLIKGELALDVELYCDQTNYDFLMLLEKELHFVFITSSVTLRPINDAPDNAQDTETTGIKIVLNVSENEKCIRCWHHHETVGKIEKHQELCQRCITNIDGEGELRFYV
jgi:isoleucyl-tRNA synthetase